MVFCDRNAADRHLNIRYGSVADLPATHCWSTRCHKPHVASKRGSTCYPIGDGSGGSIGTLTNPMNFVSAATLALNGGLPLASPAQMTTETCRYRGYDIVPNRPMVPMVRERLYHARGPAPFFPIDSAYASIPEGRGRGRGQAVH